MAAVLNAFSEEMTYKASFLSVLEGAVGRQQALLLMAAFFGILHFYGVPYGIIGVLMAGLLGWLLGKSMLETRGLFWAWFIHFWQDVAIFIFLAIGSITPGG
ncbi:CPBP family intramembrane metalloprotease [bacterium]|nr:MAG: CPBP family intramembrane metalloprotease [bacterium]